MMFSKKLDIHSAIHFLGCYAMVPTIAFLVGGPEHFTGFIGYASMLAALCGVMWEILDEWNHDDNWNIVFLDPRGADFLDILVDFAGVLLAYFVF